MTRYRLATSRDLASKLLVILCIRMKLIRYKLKHFCTCTDESDKTSFLSRKTVYQIVLMLLTGIMNVPESQGYEGRKKQSTLPTNI